MNDLNNDLKKLTPKDYLYFILTAIAAVPVWLATSSFVDAIGVHEQEAVATAVTMCFFGGVFLGRYLIATWASRLKTLPASLIILLSVLIVVSIIELFVHAEYPLEGRRALNILLYWIPFVMLSVGIGMLVKIVRAVTQNQLNEAQTSAAHSKSELHLLQSQLSPHFLFNTLNNMYGLSITQHEKVPPLLLKLSDLLRYSIYDATETFVPLKDEMAYINNYIDFEKIRLGDRLVLSTDFEEITREDIKIAPMLLIVFIENAFKHSKNTAEPKIFIDIQLKIWADSILFSIKNSCGLSQEPDELIPKHSGFGLTSVNKRLELLYPGQHELQIKNEASSYSVILQLKMK
ncbi:sensor histidine kinase [Dyadobacter diqingensis]|uniref:sensor histidine kinase n=1 Tax=Dyadobacter diqingensis TaxID=2938121 RepID=UPI0020C18C5D|nr:histidine kinase [Dyadobacter diqingensis]